MQRVLLFAICSVLTTCLSALSLGEQSGTYLPEGEAWIVIDTARRQMVVKAQRSQNEYRVALGPSPDEPKRIEGDGATPRGRYSICNRFRSERFHRFLALSYPSHEDAKRGLSERLLSPLDVAKVVESHSKGVCPNWESPLGGHIGIHGWGRNETIAERHAAGDDWTDGCIGVTNLEIEAIFDRVQVGTAVIIF